MDVVYRRCCGLDIHKRTVVACLLLLDESGPSIRRVEYDVDREIRAVRASGMPHARAWVRRR